MRHLKLGLACCSLLLSGLAGCQSRPDHHAEATAAADSLALDFDTTTVSAPEAATTSSWHRLRRPTPAGAPLIVYRGSPRPAVPDTAAPPVSEARLTDLTLKPSEYFKIDPTKAAEVRGQEGTLIRIPAAALVDARQAPVKETVWLELKECYSLADMLLSNLTTVTTDEQLFQAGGMVFVRASVRGQALHLAPGRTMQLIMPTPRRRADVQLLAGQGARGQAVRWAATGPGPVDADLTYTEASPMPAYGEGPAALSKLLRHPATAAARQTQGTVYVACVVDETGHILSPRVLRGIGDGCDEEALRVLRASSGRWQPGLRDGQAVKVKLVLPFRFPPAPGSRAAPDSTARNAASPPPTDELPAAGPAGGYVFQSTQLGWLACARRWNPAGAPTVYHVATEPDAHTTLRLICRGEGGPAILPARPQDEAFIFQGAPANRKATLIGLRYFNQTPFIALREIYTNHPDQEALIFRETTLEGLESYLEKLGSAR